jgi:hypothetical protein
VNVVDLREGDGGRRARRGDRLAGRVDVDREGIRRLCADDEGEAVQQRGVRAGQAREGDDVAVLKPCAADVMMVGLPRAIAVIVFALPVPVPMLRSAP